jgi:hypothetical protein
MQNMASYGRNGDTAMAHLTPGETVVPQAVLQQNPQVARGLGRAFQDVGADPSRYVVGSGQNSMNPMTGQPEFFLDKLIPFLTKAASNPMVQGAFGNAALRKLQGKDVGLRDLLLGGVGGAAAGGFTGRGTGMSGLDSLLGLNLDSDSALTQAVSKAPVSMFPTDPGGAVVEDSVNKLLKKNMGSDVARAEGLLGIGETFNTDTSSPIGRLLNNKFGEALTMGLGSQLIDALFSKDEDPDPGGNLARFNRGSGNAPVTFRPRERNRESEMLYANEGGPAYFPRRNGGIMPSEGSGTEDDVPAMLTAGEFVMTRDAVKGAGNGDLNQGINKMYGMMDSLERTA